MNWKYIYWVMICFSLVGWGPFSYLSYGTNKEAFGTDAWIKKETQIIKASARNLDTSVLKLALKAYVKTQARGLANKPLLTIIDYSKPSSERRLWVVNMHKGSVLYNTWVTHGRNSGGIYTTSFSNRPGSLQSSYGVFLTTDEPYIGHNGYSLRLVGLEPGINDNAYKRAIVIHGAWYADPQQVKERGHGHLGRSWGCPTVSARLAKPLIDTIKEKTVIFAYADNRRWISNSPYLNG